MGEKSLFADMFTKESEKSELLLKILKIFPKTNKTSNISKILKETDEKIRTEMIESGFFIPIDNDGNAWEITDTGKYELSEKFNEEFQDDYVEIEDVKPKDFFDEDGKFISKLLGDKIIKIKRFITLMDTEQTFIYDRGLYKRNGEGVIKQFCKAFLQDKFSKHRLSEVVCYVKVSTLEDREELPINLINVKNGLYDIEKKELLPHDPKYFTVTQLPVEFDPEANCPVIKKFIKEIVHKEDFKTVQDMIGYCLYRSHFIQTAFMFIGDGSNGKSTLLDLLKEFLGSDNCSSIGLQELENRFAISNLYGKLANIYADLPDKDLRATGKFKMLTGGDSISAEQKFKDHFLFKNYAKLIFSCNKLPETSDDTSAFYRRWIFLNFPNIFDQETADKNLLDKMIVESELSGLLNFALDGMYRIKEECDISNSKSTEENREKYILMSSPIDAFFDAELDKDADGWIEKGELYQKYIFFCKERRLPTMALNFFSMKLKEKIPYIGSVQKKIGKSRPRAWTGIKFKERTQGTQGTQLSLI